MDMISEDFEHAREYFKVLGMVKLAVDFGIEKNQLKHIPLLPAYTGTTIDMMDVFDTILSKVDALETHYSGVYNDDYEDIKQENLSHTTFSTSGKALMERFKKDGELVFYHIDSDLLDDFPYELSGNRMNVDECATIGKTATGIVIVFVMDFGEPDYVTALQEVIEHIKYRHEAERN